MRAKVSFDGYIIFFSRPKPKRHLRFVWLNDGFEFSTGVSIPEVEHFHGGKAAGHVAWYVVRDCVSFERVQYRFVVIQRSFSVLRIHERMCA